MAKKRAVTKRAAAEQPRKKKTGAVNPEAARLPNGFSLGTDVLESNLLTGESAGLLQDYFGPENYERLRDLAREAATRSVRGGPRVFILPGIMGSTLGRDGFLGDNVLWIDPVEIALGRLKELTLDGGASRYRAIGVILFAYLQLKLRLKIAGQDADFFPYDWRRSLRELGAELAAAIKAESREVTLVAHSMGGLVARSAMRQLDTKKVKRLVMMGTPNYGSFAPVQVVRGTYDVVLKVAAVDQKHDAKDLSGQVFNTFPGLYEMLPAPEKFSALNLYKAASWPAEDPRPRQELLTAVKAVIGQLAPADDRFYLIAGVNHDTVTGLALSADGKEFTYEISPAGDGTVPLDFARLDGIPASQSFYVEEGHGSLPNNGDVIAAVIDIVAKGTTAALPKEPPRLRRASRMVSEGQVRSLAIRAPGVGQLGSSDVRHLLDAVAAPPKLDTRAAPQNTEAVSQTFHHLTIGRRRQRRLELTLALGSLTEIEARAYVLGVFRNVAPGGAALALDRRLDGAISDFTARRMFGGEVGSIFTVPVGSNRLPADMILFAGLGPFDRFDADVQKLVAESVIRFLVRSRVDDFATIMMGAGSGQSAAASVQNLLAGFLRGLTESDARHRFRRLTLCESDPDRYEEMKNEIYRIAGTALFDDVEITLDEMVVPESARPAERVVRVGPEPVYTIIRQETESKDKLEFRVSVLGTGMKAAVVSAQVDVSKKEIAKLIAEFDNTVAPPGHQDVVPIGHKLCSAVLPQEVRTVLESLKDRHVVVVHDAPASRMPWETLTIGTWSPALHSGLTRRYLADHLPLATYLEQRRREPTLRLLLIVNPLRDLAGADKEGERIEALASATARIEVQTLKHDKAERGHILELLRSGRFDCVHYAGHAFFDPKGPSRSGLICARKEILTGTDLMGISNLPFLIFFNACEGGRVRKPASTGLEESFGVAEALMRGGVANYLSTYWPVGDAAAEAFAHGFYTSVLESESLGAALLKGRQAVHALQDRDWADYLLYGDAGFVLKEKS